MQQAEKAAKTGAGDETAAGSTDDEKATQRFYKADRDGAQRQKVAERRQSRYEVEPGAMVWGTDRHEMRWHRYTAAKNAAKALVVGHFPNTMMIHQHGQP